MTNLAKAQKTLRRPKQSIEALVNKNVEIGNNKCTEVESIEFFEKRNVENNFRIKTTNTYDAIRIEKDIGFQNDTFLSKTRFTQVKIIGFSKGKEFWVHKVDQDKIFQGMMCDLQNIVKRMPKTNPIIGNIYGYKFEDLWYRIKIISLNPTTIFYIDHGIIETVEINDFREINDLNTMIPFTRKIRLSKNARKECENLKINHIIYVKPIAYEENVIIVDVKSENKNSNNSNRLVRFESQSNVKSSTTVTKDNASKITSNLSSDINEGKKKNEDKRGKCLSPDTNKSKNKNEDKKNKKKTVPHNSLPNVINLLSVNACGFLKVNVILQNKEYGITLRPSDLNSDFKRTVTELPEKCASVKLNHEYKLVL